MNIENKIITTIENAKQNVVKITTSKKKGFLECSPKLIFDFSSNNFLA